MNYFCRYCEITFCCLQYHLDKLNPILLLFLFIMYLNSVLPVKHPNRHPNVPRVRTREQRAEMRQKNYRYLYQVRTAHGDIISQVRYYLFLLISIQLM